MQCERGRAGVRVHDDVDTRVFVHVIRRTETFVLPKVRGEVLVEKLSRLTRFALRLEGFESRQKLLEEFIDLVHFGCATTGAEVY